MKKTIAILLSLAFLLCLCGCVAEEPTPSTTVGQTNPPSSPLLYKVTDSEGNTIYLLGSIHFGKEEMYPLPNYVLDAFDSSDVLAVEVEELDAETGAFVDGLGKLPEGTSIKDYVSEETYQAALRILQENEVYDDSAEQYKPVVWYSNIQTLTVGKSTVDYGLGVDQYMMQLAQQSGKTIEGIETVEGHYRAMSDLSMELQELLLKQAVQAYRNGGTGVSMSVQCKVWAAGQEAAWEGASVNNVLANVDQTQLPLWQEYYKAIQTDRDQLMTQYAKDALASGKTVFICVGMAHVVPEGGMIDQLTAAGYTVERVTG